MVDVAEILALAPDADNVAAAAVARILNSKHKLLGAAICRDGHLHLLTSRGLFVGYESVAYEEVSKYQLGGAVVLSATSEEASVGVLGWGGVQPPHRFVAGEGLAFARRINDLAGQPPNGPPVRTVGRGRVTVRPTSWRMPGMAEAGDECQVILVPDGIQLFLSSGAYPMSTVFGRGDLVGVLAGDKPTLVFRSHQEFLEVELDATPSDIATIVPGLKMLELRPTAEQGPPVVAGFEPRHAQGGPVTSDAPAETGAPRTATTAVSRSADEGITTRDGLSMRLVVVPAADAAGQWDELIRSAEATQEWPVILGDRLLPGVDEVQRLLEDMTSRRARPAADLLYAAEALDVRAVLARRWEESLPIDEDADDPEAMEVFDESQPPGPVPPMPAPLTPTSGKATIAIVPAAAGEEIFAVIGWGDWNACPPAEEHVAILREWRRRYGAVVKAISPDTVELAVARPPVRFEDALVLAREQYAYAPDIVDQGEHATIGILAAALVDSASWHFWWD